MKFRDIVNEIRRGNEIDVQVIIDFINYNKLPGDVILDDVFCITDYLAKKGEYSKYNNKLIVNYNNNCNKINMIENSIDALFNSYQKNMGMAFYIHKCLLELELYERADKFANDYVNIFFSSKKVTNKSNNDKKINKEFDLDDLIKKIDCKIAELEEQEK